MRLLQGQLHAVMSHSLSNKEVAVIKNSNVPMMVIHGRHDILAMPKYGEKLARRYCRMTNLQGVMGRSPRDM